MARLRDRPTLAEAGGLLDHRKSTLARGSRWDYTPLKFRGEFLPNLFYDRGAIKDPAHTGTSKGLSQAIDRGPIIKFLPKYANVYVTIQSHGLSAGARTHYVTANGVRNGLEACLPYVTGSCFPFCSPDITSCQPGYSLNSFEVTSN